MEAFDLRRVDLCSGDPAKQWFLLNSAICGGKPGKFMARCPLVENFPSEFAVIQVADMKDGGLPDRRVCKGEVAFVASLFGVFSAILRKTFKESERDGYIWLMDTINSLQIGIDQQPNPATPTVAQNDKLNVSPPVVSSDLLESIQMENFKLKAELEDAVCRLESLRQEVETFSHSTRSQPEESASDVWTLISDVREKYQLPLASAIADQVHNPEVGKLLSEIAEELTAKKGPKQAFETMLGDSVLHFFQSLRVPDWVLLYFKLQAKIPDQGWQTLLSLTNLGRTGVSYSVFWQDQFIFSNLCLILTSSNIKIFLGCVCVCVCVCARARAHREIYMCKGVEVGGDSPVSGLFKMCVFFTYLGYPTSWLKWYHYLNLEQLWNG